MHVAVRRYTCLWLTRCSPDGWVNAHDPRLWWPSVMGVMPPRVASHLFRLSGRYVAAPPSHLFAVVPARRTVLVVPCEGLVVLALVMVSFTLLPMFAPVVLAGLFSFFPMALPALLVIFLVLGKCRRARQRHGQRYQSHTELFHGLSLSCPEWCIFQSFWGRGRVRKGKCGLVR